MGNFATEPSRALLNYDEGDIKSVHYGDILIKYPAILNIKKGTRNGDWHKKSTATLFYVIFIF